MISETKPCEVDLGHDSKCWQNKSVLTVGGFPLDCNTGTNDILSSPEVGELLDPAKCNHLKASTTCFRHTKQHKASDYVRVFGRIKTNKGDVLYVVHE